METKPCEPDGRPIDPEDLKRPRLFNGVELIVFDSSEEFNRYMGYLVDESPEEDIQLPPTE